MESSMDAAVAAYRAEPCASNREELLCLAADQLYALCYEMARANPALEAGELVGPATEALVDAADRWDSRLGVRFWQYAAQRIRWYVRNYQSREIGPMAIGDNVVGSLDEVGVDLDHVRRVRSFQQTRRWQGDDAIADLLYGHTLVNIGGAFVKPGGLNDLPDLKSVTNALCWEAYVRAGNNYSRAARAIGVARETVRRAVNAHQQDQSTSGTTSDADSSASGEG